MEYLVIGLLIVLVGIIWFKNPSKMKVAVTDSVLKSIKDNREVIAKGVLEKLPEEVKSKLPLEVADEVLLNVIDKAIEVIQEGLK